MRGICGSVFHQKHKNLTQGRSQIPCVKYGHKHTQSNDQGDLWICVFLPPTPPIYIRTKGRSQIPPCECATRGSVGGWCWGSYLTPTTTFGSRRKRHPKAWVRSTRSRCSSTEAKTKNEEGKTKMGFQNWATPLAFIAWCEKEVLPTYGYDRFSLDACAEPHNTKAHSFLAPVEDDQCMGRGCVGVNGLNASWANYGAVWCNPGFSACAQWLDKAASEAEKGTTSLVLTHACHGARWFGTRLAKANAVYLINPRINFLPPVGVEPSSNNRDSYLWVFSGRCRPTQKFVYPNRWRN